MHYYQFNIADYRKDTQHLSPIEHYIYRELMDWYYLDEAPIPKETQRVIRRLRLVSENNQDLTNVLDEFFEEGENGWVHGRIEREIASYRAKVDTARANGSKGGRPKKPKKTQSVNSANPEKTGSKANHKPLTNNHSNTTTTRPTVSDVADYVQTRTIKIDPQSFVDYYTANGWKVGRNTMKDWKAAVRNWEKNEHAKNRPTTNSAAPGRKLTPAERVAARHAEIYGEQPTTEASAVDSVVAVQ